MLELKLHKMRQLMKEMGSVLVAYSGGIDSTLVLKVAHEALGSRTVGVTAVSPTLPSAELESARLVAAQIGVRHLILETDQLEISDFVRNDATRCYHCKTDLYQGLAKLRQELTLGAIVDGTNLDDLGDDRPGLLAAREWGVRSPLVEAEVSKDEVRALAKELGLSNWDKPAAACLSSRIARGVPITKDNLSRVEQAEAFLLDKGFRQVRVRDDNGEARVEVGQDELATLFEPAIQTQLTNKLRALGFEAVTLDRKGYRRGGAN